MTTDSEKAHNEAAHGAPIQEKATALGNYKSNFRKLKALFAGAKVVNNDGNPAVQLAHAVPATISELILPDERTAVSDSIRDLREILVEPFSTSTTTTQREEEALTGKRRIIRHWYDATPKNVDKFISNFLSDPENTRLDSFWKSAEAFTLVHRRTIFYGFCLAALLYIIIGNMSRLMCNFVGFIYPLHASHHALKSKSRSHYADWLKYWCVYSTFAILDTFVDYYLRPYSAYWFLKCLFVGYLLAPFTQGTNYVFVNYVERFEAVMDSFVEEYNQWEKDDSLISDSSNTDGRSAEKLSAELVTAVLPTKEAH